MSATGGGAVRFDALLRVGGRAGWEGDGAEPRLKRDSRCIAWMESRMSWSVGISSSTGALVSNSSRERLPGSAKMSRGWKSENGSCSPLLMPSDISCRPASASCIRSWTSRLTQKQICRGERRRQARPW